VLEKYKGYVMKKYPRLFLLVLVCLAVGVIYLAVETVGNEREEESSPPRPGSEEIKSDSTPTSTNATTFESDFFTSIDSAIFSTYTHYKFVYQKEKAKLYFVKQWNTPDFYNIPGDEEWTGCSWDAKMFLGYKEGNYVYYIEEYKGRSREFKNSSVLIEKKFPLAGVTLEERSTCWWISATQDVIGDTAKFNLDSLLNQQVSSLSDDKMFCKGHIASLKERILKTEGSSDKQKFINFTRKALKGNPKNWNAWEWPGYYGDDNIEIKHTSKVST
jgi:hypothetical protein